MLMSCGVIYLIFAKSEVQPWNDPENMKKPKKDAEKPTAELEPLKKTENEEANEQNKEETKTQS